VYLEAKQDLVRVAVTFGLGDQQSQLRFVATPDTPLPLAQDGHLGVIAAAWLNGVSVRAGERLLLGYVAGPTGASANLKVYGLSASGLDDTREASPGAANCGWAGAIILRELVPGIGAVETEECGRRRAPLDHRDPVLGGDPIGHRGKRICRRR
jgi:hypothetical protein